MIKPQSHNPDESDYLRCFYFFVIPRPKVPGQNQLRDVTINVACAVTII